MTFWWGGASWPGFCPGCACGAPRSAGPRWAQARAPDPELVRLQAEARLDRPAEGLLHGGQIWQVAGLEADGGLRLQRPGASVILQRSF